MLIDIKKAFHSIDRKKMIDILIAHRIPNKIVSAIALLSAIPQSSVPFQNGKCYGFIIWKVQCFGVVFLIFPESREQDEYNKTKIGENG